MTPQTPPSPELLPCPFCGGEAVITKRGTARCSMIVTCEWCGAFVESGDVVGLTNPRSYKWNRREPHHLEAHNKALREALEALVSYTEACEGLLNASPAGQVIAARQALAATAPK